jgi:hypothetical protein
VTTIALIAWPVLTLFLVLRLSFQQAVLISLLGGFLLLPVEGGFDLPLLPGFHKDSIPALTLLLLALLLHRQKARDGGSEVSSTPQELPGWLPRSTLAIGGLLMLVLGAQMTALTNGDSLVYGPTVIRGLNPYDGGSIALTGMTMLIPLFLGRKFFAYPEGHLLLLRGLAIGGVAYSLLALYEVRMSPQLSNMVYGFFPHDWRQHVRSGGWRPVVFMEHGLQLAIFFAMAGLAAFGASRLVQAGKRTPYMLAGAWILGTLLLSNSLGATVIAFAFLPVVLLLNARLQVLCAALVAGMLVLYPMLRSADVVPTDRLVSMAAQIDPDRASSLQFRFNNEDLLLDHMRDRPVFGWGINSRHRLFNERGQDIVVTDGFWIITIGEGGWVGYLAQFGLLTLPIILLAFAMRRYEVSSVTAILAVVLVATLINLIPNGHLSPVTVLVAGALWGRWELGRITETVPEQAAPEPRRGVAYAREISRTRRSGTGEAAPARTVRDTPTYTRQATRNRRLREHTDHLSHDT